MAGAGDSPALHGKGLCQDRNEEGQPQTPSTSCQCPEHFVRLSQCHQQPPRWERGVLGAARCRRANSATCPRFCESALNPSAVARARAEPVSPVPTAGTRPAPSIQGSCQVAGRRRGVTAPAGAGPGAIPASPSVESVSLSLPFLWRWQRA